MVSNYTYDTAGQLLALAHQLRGAAVASFGYTYDLSGNRTSMTDEYGTHNYLYDQLSRLIQATHPHPANPLERFNYDLVGNRLGSSNTYNAVNQLLEDENFIYSYDRNGNTISKVNKATGGYTRYRWNAENQLTRISEYNDINSSQPISVSKYIYDGNGRRVVKKVNGKVTKYVYDQEDILLETDDNDKILARYTHGPGADEPLIMQRDTNNDGTVDASYYYVLDGLNSVVKLLDAAGTVVNNYVYNAFGKIVAKTETVPNPYTYTSREYDAESGLYYYRARYYDAQTGRFLSEDPIGFMGGMNFYSYVGNNPMNFIDPLGLVKSRTWEGLKQCVRKCVNTHVPKLLLWLTTGGVSLGAYWGHYFDKVWQTGWENGGPVHYEIHQLTDLIQRYLGGRILPFSVYKYLVYGSEMFMDYSGIIGTAVSGYFGGVAAGCIGICAYDNRSYDCIVSAQTLFVPYIWH